MRLAWLTQGLTMLNGNVLAAIAISFTLVHWPWSVQAGAKFRADICSVSINLTDDRWTLRSESENARRGWVRALIKDSEDVAHVQFGAEPGHLPMEVATRYKLVVNLKIAKALGITLSPSLLLQATEVIE